MHSTSLAGPHHLQPLHYISSACIKSMYPMIDGCPQVHASATEIQAMLTLNAATTIYKAKYLVTAPQLVHHDDRVHGLRHTL